MNLPELFTTLAASFAALSGVSIVFGVVTEDKWPAAMVRVVLATLAMIFAVLAMLSGETSFWLLLPFGIASVAIILLAVAK